MILPVIMKVNEDNTSSQNKKHKINQIRKRQFKKHNSKSQNKNTKDTNNKDNKNIAQKAKQKQKMMVTKRTNQQNHNQTQCLIHL